MIVSVDVGGTFTDILVMEEGLKHYKIPSTRDDPAEAVIQGFPRGGDVFIHGTTVATNAFLEGRGVRTAFITNRNFEDLLLIGRQVRPNLYELHIEKPKPPLAPEDSYGVVGRIGADGEIHRSIDIDEIKKLAVELKEKNCAAAVCLLHSYKNKGHEKTIGEIFRSQGIPHSLSHEVSNEFREYERGVTTLLDAYLRPVVRDYFKSLKESIGIEPLVMKSSGGLEPSSSINPIDTFYSGPAGGAAGGEYMSEVLGAKDLITFDMGGTSADMATIISGKIGWKDQGCIGGFPVQSRMADIVTIGAGGGSTAWVDDGDILRVGPKSAGARPGPACYGLGGIEPTLTDALLLAGYIDKDYFLGGRIELYREPAETAVNKLCEKLNMPTDKVIMGVIRVANSKMSRCMKEITVERGLMPSKFSILAFGGAGPLHAAYLAEELGIDRVYVPPLPGVFSALGMLTGDIVTERSRTLLLPLKKINEVWEAVKELSQGQEGERRVYLALRYKGQSHHLNIPLSEDVEERFHQEHKRHYGYADEDGDIEIVNLRVEHRKKREFIGLPDLLGPGEHPQPRKCLFPGGEQKCSVFYRKHLPQGAQEKGPAVVEDMSSTILIPPRWSFSVKQKGILELVRV
ncbi:MAG: hydantoinase/oxoprolinase family protein [Thermoplasmata archaeon]